MVAGLVREGSRTICFMKSRKGVELVARLTKLELEASGDLDLADRVAPYRAGYTAQQRRELEARLTNGELLAVVTTDALELGIDIGALDAAVGRDVPGDRRLAAPDVGARRPARARAGRLRGRRGRAGPVLLPPSRRVPGAAGRGGDPPLRERADPPGRTCSAPPTRARSRTPTPRPWGRVGGSTPTCWSARATWSSAAAASSCAAPEEFPAARGVAALGLARQLRRGRRRPGRAAGERRVGPRVQHRPRRRGVPAPRALLRGQGARRRRAPGARRPLRGRVLHAAQEGDDDGGRAPAGPARDAGRRS